LLFRADDMNEELKVSARSFQEELHPVKSNDFSSIVPYPISCKNDLGFDSVMAFCLGETFRSKGIRSKIGLIFKVSYGYFSQQFMA